MPPADPAVEPQALQVGHGHRDQGVRGPAPAALAGRAGRRSPTTRSTGRSSTRTRPTRRVSDVAHHPHRRADRPDRGRRLADPHRSDVRPAGPDLQVRLGHALAQDRRARPSPPRSSARSTSSCSPTTTTPTTSTTPAARCCRRPAPSSPTRRRPRASAGTARGLDPWETTLLEARRPADDRRHRDAVPPRPAAEPPIVGDVIGFALRWDGQRRRRALDLGRHRALRRRARGRRAARRRHRGPPPRRASSSRSPARSATR